MTPAATAQWVNLTKMSQTFTCTGCLEAITDSEAEKLELARFFRSFLLDSWFMMRDSLSLLQYK